MRLDQRFKVTIFAALLGVSLHAGPASAARGGLSDGGGSTEPQSPACAGLAGATFVSLNEYETGLGPDGPVLGHWQIDFDASAYHYRLSDFSLSDNYQCSGQEGFVTNGLEGARKLSGYYLKDAGLLLWNERWFRQVPFAGN